MRAAKPWFSALVRNDSMRTGNCSFAWEQEIALLHRYASEGKFLILLHHLFARAQGWIKLYGCEKEWSHAQSAKAACMQMWRALCCDEPAALPICMQKPPWSVRHTISKMLHPACFHNARIWWCFRNSELCWLCPMSAKWCTGGPLVGVLFFRSGPSSLILCSLQIIPALAFPLFFDTGGPFGHSDSVRERADDTIALSKLVLNHQVRGLLQGHWFIGCWTNIF